MSRLKELFSDTAIYGLSSVVARFLGYLLVPFYTSYFLPGEYGVIGLIYAGIGFLNVVFTFGMESSYIRYATERESSRDVFRTLQTIILAVGTVLAGLMFLGAGWMQPLMSLHHHDADLLYMLLIGILWFDALSIVPFAELRLIRKAWLYAGIRIVNVLINLSLNFWLVAGLQWGIEAVLWSNVIASSLTTIVLLVITRSQLSGSFQTGILRNALLFGLPYVPNGLGYAVNEFLDRFYINAMSSDDIMRLYGEGVTAEDLTGIYNACYKLAIFMTLGVQMFRMAWQPFFMKYAQATDTRVLFAGVFDWFNVIAASLFLIIGLFAVEIAAIPVPFMGDATLIDSRYWSGLSIVPFLLIAYWFQGWFVNFSAGIFIKDQTSKLPGITLVGASITILANIWMVPLYGMVGPAIVKVLAYGTMSMLLLYYARKAMQVDYRIVRALILMGVMAALVWLGTGSDLDFIRTFEGRLLLIVCGLLFVFLFGKPQKVSGN
ncbi:MAG: polysaccharide biosynthesis C-terminal domain-containing protein [Bacteroidetes bacterium]|nr:polysaccharide biosynthesis C-terminal domain-containing protein [Bacteroidota bacterium]MCH8524803.1 oligosaccharide flippase family protein [Balneolales bacterium]